MVVISLMVTLGALGNHLWEAERGGALAFASELTNAEDFQDVLAKQSRYAQTQMQSYDLQAQELGRLMVGTERICSRQPKL
jgi:hypothetical protein